MKRIVTPKVTTLLILGYFVLQLTALLTANTFRAVGHEIFPIPRNTSKEIVEQLFRRMTLYSYIYRIIQQISNNIFTVILYGTIVVETVLLIFFFKVNMKSRASLVSSKNEKNLAKENRLIKSVIGVCVFYIVTSSPRNLDQLMAMMPYSFLLYSLRNFIVVLYGLYPVLDGINHSFNLFIYIAVNPRFRVSLARLFKSRFAGKFVKSQ